MTINFKIFESIKLINVLSLKVNCSLGARCLSFWAFIFVFLSKLHNLFKSDLMCAIKNQFPKVFLSILLRMISFISPIFVRDAVKINNLWSHFYVFAIKKRSISIAARWQFKDAARPEKRNERAWNSIFFSRDAFGSYIGRQFVLHFFTLWMFNYTSLGAATASSLS